MKNEKIEKVNSVEELVELIKKQDFSGTNEEKAIQQILFLDKYIKENIDYDFEAAANSINMNIERLNNPTIENERKFSEANKNPAFKDAGFWQGKALCGSISSVAQQVLNKLGIPTEYVYGTPAKGMGHRWNIVTIEGKDYMIDFTLSLCTHKYDEESYKTIREFINRCNENDFLFFDFSFYNKNLKYPFSMTIGTSDNQNLYNIKGEILTKKDIQELENRVMQIKPLSLNRENNIPKKDISDEQLISETFGIDITRVQHMFLENGTEVYSFYSEKLGRKVILEKEKNGKSLREQLETLQKQNNQFQTKNGVENTHDILMNERNEKNIELAMYSKNEIINHSSIIESMSKDKLRKLKYMLSNYDALKIKGINLEHLIFIDNNNSIFEMTMDNNQKITVSEPKDENAESKTHLLENVQGDNQFHTKIEQGNDFFDEKNKEEEDNIFEKPKVYTYTNKDGYVNIILLIISFCSILLLGIIAYILLR